MYINADDLARAMSKAELVQLTNDEPRATEPNGEIVQTAIAYACDLVDGYLAGRYPLPLAQTPTILPPLCINIARHFLHARRINRADFPKTLEQIRDGKIHIGIDTADKPRQPERGAYHVRAGAKHDWSGY